MKQEVWIPACSGRRIDVRAGQKIAVVDVRGGQVADFFAECADDPEEFLSTAVTIDCNESLRLKTEDIVYSNLYRPLLRVVRDDVGQHDLLFPSCRKETYDFFYRNGEGHPNCYDNINVRMDRRRPVIQPLNLFMNTKVEVDGRLTICPPVSKAGDCIVLEAFVSLHIGIAACSVSEGACNGGSCKPIRVLVED